MQQNKFYSTYSHLQMSHAEVKITELTFIRTKQNQLTSRKVKVVQCCGHKRCSCCQ